MKPKANLLRAKAIIRLHYVNQSGLSLTIAIAFISAALLNCCLKTIIRYTLRHGLSNLFYKYF